MSSSVPARLIRYGAWQTATMPSASAASSRKRARFSSGCTAGFQTRGLCGKTCTERQPSATARPIASWIPPELETWAPNSTPEAYAGKP